MTLHIQTIFSSKLDFDDFNSYIGSIANYNITSSMTDELPPDPTDIYIFIVGEDFGEEIDVTNEGKKYKVHYWYSVANKPSNTIYFYQIGDNTDVNKFIEDHNIKGVRKCTNVGEVKETLKIDLGVQAIDIVNAMKPPICCFNIENILTVYTREMEGRGIGHLPVKDIDTEHEQLIGLISDTDILPYTVLKTYPEVDGFSTAKVKALKTTDPDSKKTVSESMTKLVIDVKNEETGELITQELITHIQKDEYPKDYLPKFLNLGQDKPAWNLLMVLSESKPDASLVGVISWVDIFKNWEKISASFAISVNDLTVKEVAVSAEVSLEKFPNINLRRNVIRTALNRKKTAGRHRHLLVKESNKLVAVYHFHELYPYDYKGTIQYVDDYFSQLEVGAQDDKYTVGPKYTLEERAIDENRKIWVKGDQDCAIERFKSYIVGEDIKWQDRLAGLLVKNKKGEYTHLLNPYNIIEYLIKKNR